MVITMVIFRNLHMVYTKPSFLDTINHRNPISFFKKPLARFSLKSRDRIFWKLLLRFLIWSGLVPGLLWTNLVWFGFACSRLEARGSRLEARGSKLEARGSKAQARGSSLEARGLKARDSMLEARGSMLEARGSRLEARGSRHKFWFWNGLKKMSIWIASRGLT